MTGPYSVRAFDTIDAVPPADWLHVCNRGAARDFMHPAFVRAVEAGGRAFARFQHVMVYAADGEPVACACLSAMTLDVSDVVVPRMSRFIKRLPSSLAELFRFRIVMCGLPVSLAQASITHHPDCDVAATALLIEEQATRLAETEAAPLIVFKEFDDAAAGELDVLRTRGYVRLETPPLNLFDPTFDSFDSYYRALKSRYRLTVKRSRCKLERGGGHVRVISRPSEILAIYTPEVHRLYVRVVEQSAMRLELLPIEFFQALTRQFPEAVDLLVIESTGRIRAFAWGLNGTDAYYCLYLGLDEEAAGQDLDLYFNLTYAALDVALRRQPKRIELGQTADYFKARLGCRHERRFAFACGRSWLTRTLCRFGSHLLNHSSAPPPRNVYRAEANAHTGTDRPQRGAGCTT